MSAIYLTESDVRELISMKDAIDVLQVAFTCLANQQAENLSRSRLRTDNVMMHILAGADRKQDSFGWKIYTTTREKARFLVGIYHGQNGELSAMIEADWLGQLRTGAASGLASSFLANPEAQNLAIIGTGIQAWTQVLAICEVRPIKQISVYSRNESNRDSFSARIQQEVNVESTPCLSDEQAVETADIICTATTSKVPVFDGTRVKQGTHINAVGSNFSRKTELDRVILERCHLIVCDERQQCLQEAGDLLGPHAHGLIDWERISELKDLVSGHVERTSHEQITIFKSVGLGLEDVALGQLIVQRAHEQGRGTPLPF